MDDVFQLANIARPAVGLELVLGFGADPYRTMPQPLAVDLYEVPGQGQDIARPVAQRLNSRLTTSSR